MYADTLMELERGHLLRLGIWALLSIVLGALVYAFIFRQKTGAPFLKHFALQLLGWGLVDAAIVAWSWKNLAFRDYESAMRLQKFLWLNVGLDAGYVGIGITIALAGWLLNKRYGALGAGVGVVVQGFALFVLDLRLLTVIDGARVAAIATVQHWLFA